MVDKSEIEIGNMKKSVPVDPSCHPRPQEPECILPRDAMTQYGYYGFEDLQKMSLNHLLRDLAMTLKAKYDLKSIYENGYQAKYTYLQ